MFQELQLQLYKQFILNYDGLYGGQNIKTRDENEDFMNQHFFYFCNVLCIDDQFWFLCKIRKIIEVSGL